MKNPMGGRVKVSGLAAAMAGVAAISVAAPSEAEAVGCYVASDVAGTAVIGGDYDAIINQGSDLPLALPALSGSGRLAEQGSMWPDAALREWTLTSIGAGEYTLVNAGRGEVLESVGRADRTGAYYDRAGAWNGGSAQIWIVTVAAPGSYTLTNKKTGRVLTVRNSSKAVGAAIQEVLPSGSASEQWSFRPAPTTQPCDHV
jgi:hypothetical protein